MVRNYTTYKMLLISFLMIGTSFSLWGQCNITSVTTNPSEPVMLCEGDTATFHFSTSGTCSGNIEYRVLNQGIVIQNWGTTDSYSAFPSDSTNYIVEARCSACPASTVSDTFIVIVTQKPTFNGVTEICAGGSTTLHALENGDETLSWWSDTTGGNQLSTNGDFATSTLMDTTTFWMSANSTSSAAGGSGKVLIAECGLDGAAGGSGSEDYIEIANLYNISINTTGWVVAISNSYSNINSVNVNLWHLPSSFSPCSVVTKTDAYNAPNYWGSNILWNPGAGYTGWAIIIDNYGNVIDFAAWGWTAADLANFNPTINGYSVTLGNEWQGDGMNPACGSQGGTQYSFARNGSDDHNDNSDFFCQPTSVNILNPGLNCGWTASKTCYYPINVLVSPTPEIDPINDTTVCGVYALPLITGNRLTGNEAYYSAPGGNGTTYQAGDQITSSMTLYVYDSLQTAQGCADEISFDVSVTPNSMNLQAGPDQEVCEGTSITLTATGANNYAWNNGVTNGTAFIPPVGTTKYTVTGTNYPCSAVDSLIVIVHPTPTVNTSNDTIICEGNTVKLEGSGAKDYLWDNVVLDGVSFIPPVGNNKYVVIGTDKYGCTNKDSINVLVNALPDVAFSADTVLGCDPFVVTFSNQTQGNNVTAFWQLSNGDTSTNLNGFMDILHTSGCYSMKLIMTNDKGCVDSLQKDNYVCVAPDPAASFIPDPAIVTTLKPKSNMINETTGAVSYIWDFGDQSPTTDEENPTHSFPPNNSRTYAVILTAISDKGCVDSTIRLVKMRELLLYYIPNTFTPDGDQINDFFHPVFNSGVDLQTYSLFIYNRWGEILFESHDTNIGWDGSYHGKIVPDGTYVWKVNFKLKDTDEHQTHHGTVTLIR